jgi:hypothetical protein
MLQKSIIFLNSQYSVHKQIPVHTFHSLRLGSERPSSQQSAYNNTYLGCCHLDTMKVASLLLAAAVLATLKGLVVSEEDDFCQSIENLSSGSDVFHQDHPCTCKVNEDSRYSTSDGSSRYSISCVAKNKKCCGTTCGRDAYYSDMTYDGLTVDAIADTQCTRYSGDMDVALCIVFYYYRDSEELSECRAKLGDTACQSCSICPITDRNAVRRITTFDCTNVPGGDLFLVSECGISDPILDTCSETVTVTSSGRATSTSAASNWSKHVLTTMSMGALAFMFMLIL